MAIELLTALAAGGAVALLSVWVARTVLNRPSDDRVLALSARPQAVSRLSLSEVMRSRRSNLPILGAWLETSPRAARWEREIARAGMSIRVGEYFVIRIMCSALTFVIVAAIGRNPVAFFVALMCGGLAFMLPAYYIAYLGKSRAAKIAKQLPEAVTLISNSLRAGFAFQYGMEMVAKEMSAPIADEFTRAALDMNVGASLEEALHGISSRADSEDMHLIVTAVLVQRQSGGNLSEILETVGETMRERERLTGEVRTMTSQQRFSGVILTFWPIAILALFSLLNWDSTSVLFTTTAGLTLLGIGAVLQLLGYYTISKILDIEI